jgi:threonine dehydrogenase-like Zn-dependent dehydrogenase
VNAVRELTDGLGAQAIIDFVGENDAIEDGIAMIEDGGFYYVIGYAKTSTSPPSTSSPAKSHSSATSSEPTSTSKTS